MMVARRLRGRDRGTGGCALHTGDHHNERDDKLQHPFTAYHRRSPDLFRRSPVFWRFGKGESFMLDCK